MRDRSHPEGKALLGMLTGKPTASLPPTARRLLKAAQSVLDRDGFDGLTFEAVVAEAGTYKDAVRYYFGSKAGLVEAMLERVTHDQSLEIRTRLLDAPDEETRIVGLGSFARDMTTSEGYSVYWDLLPHALRDAEQRQQVASMYEWHRGHYRALMDRLVSSDSDRERTGELVGSMTIALIDGMAVQHALDEEAVDLDAIFGFWSELLLTWVSRRTDAPMPDLDHRGGASSE